MPFTTTGLKAAGFVGWIPFEGIRSYPNCPATPGVYVVTFPPGGEPIFSADSSGGWFKGRNPAVTVESLRANWVTNAEVIYIGKSGDVRRRLVEFAKFGTGKAIGHWGGRLIWQLAEAEALRVAWRETPVVNPAAVERELIASFRSIYGKPPFANDPHRLGG